MKILSFVIPAYNSAPFLAKCLNSLLLPELLDTLEVIVVNDGSTDATPAIAQEYTQKYPGTVRLITQQNRGHGGALNTGCAAAAGKYIKVLDADDWVQTQNLPALLSELAQCQADVVLTNYRTVNIATGETVNWRCFPPQFGRDYTLSEIMQDWRGYDRGLTFHGIFYRADFYKSYAEPLPEHLFYEDHVYAAYPCCLAAQVRVLPLFIYEYRIGDTSQSVSAANQLKRLGQTMQVLQCMLQRYRALPPGAGRQYAAMKLRGLAMSYLTTALLVDPDKPRGRQSARELENLLQGTAPEIWALLQRNAQIFGIFNRLHLGKGFWDGILHSRLYNLVRGNHAFD